MELLVSCPLPVRPCMQGKSVVVIEEGYGGDDEQEEEYSQYGRQCAEGYDTPYNQQQRLHGEVHAKAGRIAEGLVLEAAHNLV